MMSILAASIPGDCLNITRNTVCMKDFAVCHAGNNSASLGPVIRINPYEVHINDPDFYDELYIGASRGKIDRWYWSVSCPPLFF